jgi:hypothetical protein
MIAHKRWSELTSFSPPTLLPSDSVSNVSNYATIILFGLSWCTVLPNPERDLTRFGGPSHVSRRTPDSVIFWKARFRQGTSSSMTGVIDMALFKRSDKSCRSLGPDGAKLCIESGRRIEHQMLKPGRSFLFAQGFSGVRMVIANWSSKCGAGRYDSYRFVGFQTSHNPTFRRAVGIESHLVELAARSTAQQV